MTGDVSLLHTFVGCNRVVGALDWGENGLIAFAAHNAVALYDVGRQQILGTLLGHGDRVNCVRWLDTMTLVSGAADGSLCLYRRSSKGSGTATTNWTLVARSTPPAPGAPITFIAGTKWAMANANETADAHVLIVTSGDGSVGVWTVDWNAAHSVLLQRMDQLMLETAALPTCAAVMRPSPTAARDLPPSLLVAVGCVDGEVRLYTVCHPPFSLKLACRLPGHSNWVRGVAFTSTRSSDNSSESILLASASQDRTVRLWRLVDCEERTSTHDAESNLLTRFAPKPHFTINGIIKYEAHVEALLLGHEDWVLSVAWQPQRQRLSEHTATLLTTSMDRTMMLWVRDEKTGLWLPRESVGDAGVNHLGYYTGVWSHDGRSLATHGYTGALHIWERDPKALTPRPASTGHYGAVVDITWSPDGEFLLTASTDQTVRVLGQLESRNGEGGESEWTELGRPQVHGHDLSCIAAMHPTPDNSSTLNAVDEDKSVGRSNPLLRGYNYASGAEEKVIRVFQSPTAFLETLDMARGLVVGVKDRSRTEAYSTFTAYGATLPALGLSNKAFRFDEHSGENGQRHSDGVPGFGAEQYDAGPDFAPTCAPSSVGGRPLEEHLSQNTLWPEIHKLYGHGNELFCLAADPKGKYLASACKSQSTATAAILLWDTATWTAVSSGIQAHTLTVTQMDFSPDGKFLASASRDRSFAVSERVEDETGPFRLVSTVTKAHGRILWGISWSPDASMVFTASRDGFLGVWRVGSNGTVQQPAAIMIGFEKQSVCCVDTCELHGDEKASGCLVAVGLESGVVVVGTVTSEDDIGDVHWREVWRSSEDSRHAGAVRKVAWRPQRNKGAPSSLYDDRTVLATCGDDHAVRLFNVCLH